MSTSAMQWVRKLQVGNPVRKAIVYVLADHHNHDTGLCCPSVETIAREANASVRATALHLGWLKARGVISADTTHGRHSNRYVLNFNWNPAPHAGSDGANHASRAGLNPAPHAGSEPPTLHHVHPNPAPRAPEANSKQKKESASLELGVARAREDEVASTPPPVAHWPAGDRKHPANGAGPPRCDDPRVKFENDRPIAGGYFLDTVTARIEEITGTVCPLYDRTLIELLDAGADPHEHIYPALRRKVERGHRAKPMAYYAFAVRDEQKRVPA